MSTSLAEQLKRLAVPQTTLLTRDKKRPSLLFDPKEAANLDKATVYQIGLDGLEELISRNIIFEQFEGTLFHPSSKQFERAIETAESNNLLNNNIKKFMLLLSPYFLFNCSYKALEWLVYRYYIHEYNKEDLLMLILPYHETNIFVRALQLLNLNEPNDKWGWLKSLQKPGVHLPKQALYNHSASDLYFIQSVSNYVLAMIKEHESPGNLVVVFNFYCTTFVGALEYSQKISEGQVSQMLPVILRGLHSEIPDFSAATYVICAQILTKTTLSDKILNRFVERISEINVANLTTQAALLLVVLYQSQKQYKDSTEFTIKNLCSKEGFIEALQGLNRDGVNIYPFLESFLTSAIKAVIDNPDNEDYGKFVDNILDQIKIKDAFVQTLFSIILDIYKPNQQYPEATVYWLKNFIKKIERQYPQAYDVTIKKLMKPTDKSATINKKKALGVLVENLSNMQDWYEIFEKLYHPSVDLRMEGIKILHKKFNMFKDKEKEGLENALIDRLNDDKHKVVYETLITFKYRFVEVMDKNCLCANLINLLTKCQNKRQKWVKVSQTVLDVLCYHFDGGNIQVFVSVLPFLLPVNEQEMIISRQIISSNFGKTSHILKDINPDSDHKTLFKQILTNWKIHSNLAEITKLLQCLQELKDLNEVQKYLAMLLITECLPEETGIDINTLVLDIFKIFLTNSNVVAAENENVIECVKVARDQKLPWNGYLSCLETLIKKTKITEDLCRLDFNCMGSFYVHVLKILISYGEPRLDSKTFEVYFEKFCNNSVELFLNVAIADNKDFTSNNLDVSCLKLVKLMLPKQNVSVEVVVPYVLVGLCSNNNKIRKHSMQITSLLAELDSKYSQFLKDLVENHQEEILLDCEQMPLVVFNLISSHTNFNFILSHLQQLLNQNYPTYVKSGIVSILSLISDDNTHELTVKTAVGILNNTKENILSEFESEIVSRNIARLNTQVAAKLNEESNIWLLVELCLKLDKLLLVAKNGKTTSISIVLLNQLDRLIFASVPASLQVVLLDLIIEVATLTQNPDVIQACNHVFKHIDLDASLVLKQLQLMRDAQSLKVTNLRKARRISVVPTVDILELLEWKKGITVLENIQAKKKIRNTSVIFGMLFEVLKKCLDFDEQTVVEYPKQLILSTILHCCNKVENEPVPESAFNMQLVVQCVRASPNPQTHHHALLLLAQSALIIPKQVLHNIIAIFTFVGSSVLRHDDAYSFQIISKIIDTIIPLLLQDGSTESVAAVLRVFVDAILDVPEHRRLPLFKQLLTRLGIKENLYIFLLIIFEAHVTHSQINKPSTSSTIYVTPKRLDIASDICCEFSPEDVLVTCSKIIEYLRKLPEEKDDKSENVNSYTFDIKRYTPKQFRHYKYTIVTYISGLLASPTFVRMVADLPSDVSCNLESTFKSLLLNILNCIQDTSKATERNVNTAQSQYWKVLLHHTYETLDAINALLFTKMFLLVIRGLMVYSISNVRKRALDLLSNKLQHSPEFFNDCDDDELYNGIVTPLVMLTKTLDKAEAQPDLEVIVQKALVCLKLVVKRIAPTNPEKFIPILELLSDLVKKNKWQENLMASLILCLGELCVNLKAHSISVLHKFMPTLVNLLKSHRRLDMPNLLLITDIAVIYKILDCLSLFLSPYIEKLLNEISSIAAKWPQNDEPKLAPFFARLEGIQNKIGTVVPLRVLLPAVEHSFQTLTAKEKFSSIQSLMHIFSLSLGNLNTADVQGNLPMLTNFFLTALETPNRETEEYVIQALVKLVLKLSESSFRPLYYKFFDWAIRTNSKSDRVITFYNLSTAFAKNLKGLFVLFAGHFLNNAATLLDACNTIKNSSMYFEDDTKNVVLIEHILKTLQVIFLYDNHRFVTKERFDVLMQPIVDQLENMLGGADQLESRAKGIITPCIVQFAVATADDALWKQMNYQILLKMRHNSPKIRLIALECLNETAKKLGEDFLPLLPETIPFLAELLEDEDEVVEKACQKAVQELEKVLGEPLQKYF